MSDEEKKELKNNYRYNFLIDDSYVDKIRFLKTKGVNVQPLMRELVYPLIDKLVKDFSR